MKRCKPSVLGRCHILFWIGATWGLMASAQWDTIRFRRLSVEDGLSQPSVLCIAQDDTGYIWLGTQDGLNRYDGYEFTVFRQQAAQPHSLSENYVVSLLVDQRDQLWVGTSGGLNRYRPATRDFQRFLHNPQQPDSISDNWINTLYMTPEGALWIGTFGGGLNRLKADGQSFQRFRHNPQDATSLSHDQVLAIHQDRHGTLWVGTYGGGLNRFDPATGQFQVFRHNPSDPKSLADDRVAALWEDASGQLWIGTWGGGLCRFDANREQFIRYDSLTSGLVHDEARTLHQDRAGNLWVGTFGGGLARLTPQTMQFTAYQHEPADPFSLNNNMVRAVMEDRHGNLWIGTDAGVALVPKGTRRFRHYGHDAGLTNTVVRSLAVADDRDLWIGTEAGLHQLDRETGQIALYNSDRDSPYRLHSDSVSTVYLADDGHLWIGGFGTGLDRLNPAHGTVTHWQAGSGVRGLSDGRVVSLLEHPRGTMWAGTYGGGLNRIDIANGGVTRFPPGNGSGQLGDGIIRALVKDERNRLWIGSYAGLYLYMGDDSFLRVDRQTDQELLRQEKITALATQANPAGTTLWVATRGGGLSQLLASPSSPPTVIPQGHIGAAEGLASDVVRGMVVDANHHVWLATAQGISRYEPETGRITNYGAADGVQAGGFYSGSIASHDGDIFTGGVNGVTAFNPRDFAEDASPPPVVFTDFLLFNRSAPLQGQDPTSPLPRDIGHVDRLVLDHRHYVFALEFAALHFGDTMRNRYAYRMEGFDNDWIYTDAKRRFATYTNLDPGRYTFHVKASNRDGVWNETGLQLPIVIEPPPWLSWWAFTLYGLVGAALIFSYVRAQRNKLRQERWVNDRLRRVDRLKDEFLANTSHELRTPLHGIIGLAESLMDGATGQLPDPTRRNLAMIVSSGRRLSHLVNDILDFSKIRDRHLDLETGPVDLHATAELVLSLSRPLVRGKDVTLINAIPTDCPHVKADHNRLQQILHNLVGNAIKFTEQGSVTLRARPIDDQQVAIRVVDTGRGIPPDQQRRIFKSFEQADGSMAREHSGTGLGLAITQELVHLHGGDIAVESTPGQGACFTFHLPTVHDAEAISPPVQMFTDDVEETLRDVDPLNSVHEADMVRTLETADGSKRPFRILVVDDEPINRQVLVNHMLRLGYEFHEAADGPAALTAVAQQGPFDLVLLDIMMPRMSGYDVCQTLRETHPPHNLPIIFLTAKNQLHDLVQGFAYGGNDYLVKPVAKAELLARVDTQLRLLAANRQLDAYSQVLEEKVARATAELKQRNRELETTNEEILKAQRRLIVQEKLASLGSLTTGIAHELSNPMNFVNNFAELILELTSELRLEMEALSRHEPSSSIGERVRSARGMLNDLDMNASAIRRHGERAKNIIQRMMTLAQGGSGKPTKTNLPDLVEDFTRMAQRAHITQGSSNQISLHFERDDALKNWIVVPRDLGRAVLNIAANAFQALEAKGSGKDRQLRVRCLLKAGTAEIHFHDNGIGIDPELFDKILQPLFTTKTTGEGHIGLGLSIAYDIVVAQHGGELNIQSEPGQWSEFIIRLPAGKLASPHTVMEENTAT